MSAPAVIHLSRVKGFRRPEGTVQVDRATIFGNPFQVGDPGVWWLPREDGKAGWQIEYETPYAINAFQAVGWFSAWLHNDKALPPRPPYLTPKGLEYVQTVMDTRRRMILDRMPTLRGKHLGCRCAPGQPCHAQVLIDIANRSAA